MIVKDIRVNVDFEQSVLSQIFNACAEATDKIHPTEDRTVNIHVTEEQYETLISKLRSESHIFRKRSRAMKDGMLKYGGLTITFNKVKQFSFV